MWNDFQRALHGISLELVSLHAMVPYHNIRSKGSEGSCFMVLDVLMVYTLPKVKFYVIIMQLMQLCTDILEKSWKPHIKKCLIGLLIFNEWYFKLFLWFSIFHFCLCPLRRPPIPPSTLTSHLPCPSCSVSPQLCLTSSLWVFESSPFSRWRQGYTSPWMEKAISTRRWVTPQPAGRASASAWVPFHWGEDMTWQPLPLSFFIVDLQSPRMCGLCLLDLDLNAKFMQCVCSTHYSLCRWWNKMNTIWCPPNNNILTWDHVTMPIQKNERWLQLHQRLFIKQSSLFMSGCSNSVLIYRISKDFIL